MENEPIKWFLLITSMKRWGNSFHVNVEKRAFCNDKIDTTRVREQLKLSDKAG